MNALGSAIGVFVIAFGAALLGMSLHLRLPDHSKDSDSRDVVKLVMGLIATMSALVLSLLIASGSSTYQAQQTEMQTISANVVLLDRLLAYYGPETKQQRDRLQQAVEDFHDRIWSRDSAGWEGLNPKATQQGGQQFLEDLQGLTPKTDGQRDLKAQALQLAETLIQTRLLMFEQSGTTISWPFLAILVFWLCMLFLGFGLFARFNVTVTAALFIGAISVGGAVFLILELNQPYQGFMRVSDAPVRNALTLINR